MTRAKHERLCDIERKETNRKNPEKHTGALRRHGGEKEREIKKKTC